MTANPEVALAVALMVGMLAVCIYDRPRDGVAGMGRARQERGDLLRDAVGAIAKLFVFALTVGYRSPRPAVLWFIGWFFAFWPPLAIVLGLAFSGHGVGAAYKFFSLISRIRGGHATDRSTR